MTDMETVSKRSWSRKKKEKTEEKTDAVKVERFDDNSFEKNNLTNEEYVKKFKRPEKKNIRKHQLLKSKPLKKKKNNQPNRCVKSMISEED